MIRFSMSHSWIYVRVCVNGTVSVLRVNVVGEQAWARGAMLEGQQRTRSFRKFPANCPWKMAAERFELKAPSQHTHLFQMTPLRVCFSIIIACAGQNANTNKTANIPNDWNGNIYGQRIFMKYIIWIFVYFAFAFAFYAFPVWCCGKWTTAHKLTGTKYVIDIQLHGACLPLHTDGLQENQFG